MKVGDIKMKMNNKGMTLVEVLAGFTLLVVLVTSFIKIIKLSSELTSVAVETKNKNLEFEEKYYEGINYTLDGTTNKAFRNGDSIYIKDKEGNIFNIYVYEMTQDDYKNKSFEKYSSGKVTDSTVLDQNLFYCDLSNIKLIQVENIHDTNIARNKVYRYLKQN